MVSSHVIVSIDILPLVSLPDSAREFVPDTFHNYATYCDISAAKIVVDQKNVQVICMFVFAGIPLQF